MRTLFMNGRVWTMDPVCPRAEAFVVGDDRILGTGLHHELEGLLGPGDLRVDLGGRTVLPGLIDAHVHFSLFSFGLIDVNLGAAPSLEAALELVRERVSRMPHGTWIRGYGFNAHLWDRWPTREDLDQVSPTHPVAFWSKDVHSLWVNSLALREAGITSRTEPPAGGHIERDEHGEPTGVLKENAAWLVWAVIPGRTQQEYLDALRLGQQYVHRMGVTGVHDMDGVDCFRALQALQARGDLQLRVFKQIPESALSAAIDAGVSTGFGNEWLRVGCLKLFADGSLGSRTAHMLTPFEGGPSDYFGVPTHAFSELVSLIDLAVQNDIAVAVHAIGDAANRTVLDAFEQIVEVSRRKGLRHRIEHAQLLSEQDLPRFVALDIIASVQPSHAPSDRDLADRYWGSRSRLAYAFKRLLRSGARLAMGSDVPVEPIDPLAGIHAAVWRKRLTEPDSTPWYPEERLTVEEAMHGFTLGAAYASGEEESKGSLSPGKLADFVILSHDIASGDEEALRTARVEATAVGGRVVYGGV